MPSRPRDEGSGGLSKQMGCALGAVAIQHHVGAVRGEVLVVGGGDQGGGVERAVEIVDAATHTADGVMMGVGAAVEQRAAVASVDLPGEAELHEQFERGVHGRERDAGELSAYQPADLLGGRVLAATAQQPEDDHALGSDALSAGAEQFAEVGISRVDGVPSVHSLVLKIAC